MQSIAAEIARIEHDALPQKSAIQKKVAVGFILSATVVLLISYLVLNAFWALTDNTDRLQDSYKLTNKLSTLLSTLKDAETGQRGYLLTFKDEYLEPYAAALQVVDREVEELGHLVAQNSNNKQQFELLKPLIQKRLALLQAGIELLSKEKANTVKKMMISGEGKQIMDEIRVIIGKMNLQEESALKERVNSLKQNTDYVIMFFIAGIILVMLILVFVYYLVNQEIVARLKFEAQVQGLNGKLRNKLYSLDTLNKELESFSYSVSHDLRAPLRSIDGFSQVLLKRYHEDLDEQGQDYLKRICANSQRMGQLIEDLLQLSRLTRSELKPQDVDLSSMAIEIAKEMKDIEPDREVSFIIQPNLRTHGDRQLLRAVLQNLLNNAWKFTSKHKSAQIEFGKTKYQNKDAYFIRDDGAGFDMTYGHKLFGAFQRLHGMTEFSGNGIGLATVQRIINRHGGEIWAEGEVEKGAIFYFTIQE